MDNQTIYGPTDSGKVISPAQESLNTLKKAMGKYGVPTGIYIDTGKEFIRVFGEGEGCVKVHQSVPHGRPHGHWHAGACVRRRP